MDYELADMLSQERAGANCQMDLIGIDVIVKLIETGIMPFVRRKLEHRHF